MDVILYSTNCPKCKVLEKKLDGIGIDYSVVTDVDVMEKKGFSSAPMLEVDGEVMEFGKAIKWISAISKAAETTIIPRNDVLLNGNPVDRKAVEW